MRDVIDMIDNFDNSVDKRIAPTTQAKKRAQLRCPNYYCSCVAESRDHWHTNEFQEKSQVEQPHKQDYATRYETHEHLRKEPHKLRFVK